jgi:hypothetical protein
MIATFVAVLCLAFGAPQAAMADSISGELAFFGTFSVSGGSSSTDLANADTINFTQTILGAATGTFAANGVVPFFTPVTMNSFTFDPFAGVDPLWVVGAFQFALNTIAIEQQSASALALSGTGIVTSSIVGLDASEFRWSFSGDNSGGTLTVYSSTNSPTPLNEPSELTTLGMLVMGMGLFGLWSRKHRNALTH